MYWAAGIIHHTTTPKSTLTSRPDTYTGAKAWLLAEIDQQIMAIQASGDDGGQLRELTTLYRDIQSLTDGLGAVHELGHRAFWLAPLVDPGDHDEHQLAALVARYADAISTGVIR